MKCTRPQVNTTSQTWLGGLNNVGLEHLKEVNSMLLTFVVGLYFFLGTTHNYIHSVKMMLLERTTHGVCKGYV